jgi:hypothetical protein
MNIALRAQLSWARMRGLRTDDKGYVEALETNLWRPMHAASRAACEQGSGDGLRHRMRALHSSSALVVNFFDYWSSADPTPLAIALGTRDEITSIEFESQQQTGLPGNPPNLDVCIALASGHTLAIQSRFGEWLDRKNQAKEPLRPKYFEPDGAVWNAAGLPKCQQVAEALRDRRLHFRHLDATQLLEHALALAKCRGRAFSLMYLYYEWDVPQSALHHEELEQFAASVDTELGFHWLTYQDAFARLLTAAGPADENYVSYLAHRYFAHFVVPHRLRSRT